MLMSINNVFDIIWCNYTVVPIEIFVGQLIILQLDFINSFNDLANSKDKRSILKRNGQILIDGKGSSRVINIISNLL